MTECVLVALVELDRRQNKAYWMSWKKFCISKDRKNMRLRDIKPFNQAMLAKLR